MYCLYYTLPSSGMFVSAREAPLVGDLNELPDKLELLRSLDDVVYVTIIADGVRLEFSLTNQDEISVVIDVSSKAVGYMKIYPKARINEFLSAFDEIVAAPELAGFSCEGW